MDAPQQKVCFIAFAQFQIPKASRRGGGSLFKNTHQGQHRRFATKNSDHRHIRQTIGNFTLTCAFFSSSQVIHLYLVSGSLSTHFITALHLTVEFAFLPPKLLPFVRTGIQRHKSRINCVNTRIFWKDQIEITILVQAHHEICMKKLGNYFVFTKVTHTCLVPRNPKHLQRRLWSISPAAPVQGSCARCQLKAQ